MEKINNSSKNLYNWKDIRRDVASETPRETDFSDVYSEKDIQSDLDRINRIKLRNGIAPEVGISDSRVQEYSVQQEIGEMDWFHENDREDILFPEGQGFQSATFLTSDYDDFCNHVDAVCLVDNALTDFQPVPFALDMTYNVTEKLDEKMSWPHPDKRINSSGFCTVKYFEDTFNSEPLLEKGRISVMPRFVIGFSPELSEHITELRMTSDGWGSLQRDEFSAKAKHCVLNELDIQSAQMLDFLEPRQDQSETFSALYSQVKSLHNYFQGALETANQADLSHPDWVSYPSRDSVYQAITSRKIV